MKNTELLTKFRMLLNYADIPAKLRQDMDSAVSSIFHAPAEQVPEFRKDKEDPFGQIPDSKKLDVALDMLFAYQFREWVRSGVTPDEQIAFRAKLTYRPDDLDPLLETIRDKDVAFIRGAKLLFADTKDD